MAALNNRTDLEQFRAAVKAELRAFFLFSLFTGWLGPRFLGCRTGYRKAVSDTLVCPVALHSLFRLLRLPFCVPATQCSVPEARRGWWVHPLIRS